MEQQVAKIELDKEQRDSLIEKTQKKIKSLLKELNLLFGDDNSNQPDISLGTGMEPSWFEEVRFDHLPGILNDYTQLVSCHETQKKMYRILLGKIYQKAFADQSWAEIYATNAEQFKAASMGSNEKAVQKNLQLNLRYFKAVHEYPGLILSDHPTYIAEYFSTNVRDMLPPEMLRRIGLGLYKVWLTFNFCFFF